MTTFSLPRRRLGRAAIAALVVLTITVQDEFVAAAGFGRLWNREGNEKRERRRQLMEQRNSAEYDDWHADASTGTVRNVKSPEEEAAEAAVKTCDGQMAISLVRANEEMQKAIDEKHDAESKLEKALNEIKSLESTRLNLEGKVADLEGKLGVERSLVEERETEITKRAEELVAAGQAKAEEEIARVKASMKELTAETEQMMVDVRSERDEAVAQVLIAMEKKTLEKDDEISLIKKTMADEAVGLQNEFNKKFAELVNERDGLVKNAMIEKRDSERAAVEKLEAAKAEHANEISLLKDKLSDLQRKLKDSTEKGGQMEGKYRRAIKELEHWEGVFSQRSYCNLTHIGEDAAFMAWVASMQASEKLNVAASQAAEAAKRLQERTLKSAEPHLKTASKMYESWSDEGKRIYSAHMKKHVEALIPHYNTYAAPIVDKASRMGKEYHTKAKTEVGRQSQQMLSGGNQLANDLFNSLVSRFSQVCPKAVASVDNFAKEHKLRLPNQVVNATSEACKYPKETVSMALKGLTLFLVVLFRRRIFRLARWLIFLPFLMIWHFSPHRLVFGRRRQSDSDPNSNGSPKKDAFEKTRQPADTPSNGMHTTNQPSVRVKKKTVRVSQ